MFLKKSYKFHQSPGLEITNYKLTGNANVGKFQHHFPPKDFEGWKVKGTSITRGGKYLVATGCYEPPL